MFYDVVMARKYQVNIRLTAIEFERLEEVHRRAQERTLGYINLADTIRELMGFHPLNAVTEEDRKYLSGVARKAKPA